MYHLAKCVIFLVTVIGSHTARILGVVPIPSYSHQIVYRPIWRELSLRGHQVTVLTTDPMNDPTLTNLTEIDLHFAYELYDVKHNFTNIIKHYEVNLLRAVDMYVTMMSDICDQELQHPEVQALIRNKQTHFDLVMVEFYYPTMFAFKDRFDCPMIGMTSLDAQIFGHDAIGNPTHPVLYPDITLPFGYELNFFERVFSTFYSVYIRYVGFTNIYPRENKAVKRHFGEEMRSLEEIQKSVSLLFVNVNPIIHNIRPILPAVIPIGGGTHIHSRNPLPRDLQKFLDESNEGVIYFSLGTNVKGKDIDGRIKNITIKVFSELPYRVLWKYEDDELPGKPANVFTAKWFPQQDILGHPNVKLFITQGGLQSMEEAIYNHVPIIGIPFYLDQQANVQKMVTKGCALEINLKKITKEYLKDTILEAIHNPKYKEKARELSNLVADQPMTGLEKAIWWTEYVLRHKGADHLRSTATDVPLYQYFLLDVILFISLILCILFLIIYKLGKVFIDVMLSLLVEQKIKRM